MALIKSIVADPNADATLRAGLGAFLDQLEDLRQANLDTTDAVIAAQAAAVLAALGPIATAAIAGFDAAAATDAIYALGGGLRYPAVTEQDVADYRTAALRDSTGQTLRAQLGAGSTAAAERIAAYERGEQAEPTADELAALVRGAFPA